MPAISAPTSSSSLREMVVSIVWYPGYSRRIGVVEPMIFVSVIVYGVLPTGTPFTEMRAPGGLLCSTVELAHPVKAQSVTAARIGKRLASRKRRTVMVSGTLVRVTRQVKRRVASVSAGCASA